MLFHNQSFEERVKFLELNVCDFPSELSASCIDSHNKDEVIMGLKELQQLFKRIYKAIELFKEEDPLESLHNVTDTIIFLYSAGCVGELCIHDEKWYLKIDKKQMKGHYKQPLNSPMEKLRKLGLYYEYYKKGNKVETIKNCDEFYLYCVEYKNLLLALNYILQKINLKLTAGDYTRMQGLFYKLDYRSILLKESTNREKISPFRTDIQKTAGEYSKILENLVQKILSSYPVKSLIKLHEYYTPHWIMQFYNTNTGKCVFNLNVAANTICMEIRLSSETIDNLALKKLELSEHLAAELNKLGCISCKNQCENQNIKEINGINYCTVYSEARLLMLYITSEEDVNSVLRILDYELK